MRRQRQRLLWQSDRIQGYTGERSADFRQACLKTTKLAAKPYRKRDFLMSFSRRPARSFPAIFSHRVRRQKAEGRRQKAKGRGQKAEVGSGARTSASSVEPLRPSRGRRGNPGSVGRGS